MNVPPVARIIYEKCQYRYSDDFSCGETAVYAVVYGCPDFHITDTRYCADHLRWFRQWITERSVFCPRCNVTVQDYEYGEL